MQWSTKFSSLGSADIIKLKILRFNATLPHCEWCVWVLFMSHTFYILKGSSTSNGRQNANSWVAFSKIHILFCCLPFQVYTSLHQLLDLCLMKSLALILNILSFGSPCLWTLGPAQCTTLGFSLRVKFVRIGSIQPHI